MAVANRAVVPSDEYLTPAQLAEELGLTERTLANNRWLNTGPAYIKLSPGRGGRVRYPRSAVNAWLAERSVNAA